MTAFLGSNTVYANYVYGGLLLGDSGGKWVSFGPGVFTAGGSHVVEWSSSSAAQTLRAQQVDYQFQKWYRIVVGATTISYQTSIDGFTWLQLASVGLTDYLADMTYIGYGYNSVNGSAGHLSVRSWEVG
ncbi:MAG: hypothetical protein K2R98_19540 [Gemmataceae bacterium]|nr:hypothetical protein [Gemmataceae bacterium]